MDFFTGLYLALFAEADAVPQAVLPIVPPSSPNRKLTDDRCLLNYPTLYF